MRLIGELLREAQASNSKDPPYFMRAADKQELREQWILGRFAGNYNKIAPRNMKYAKHLNPPEPDFEVFDDGKHWILDAEVTEALDADRKRDLELSALGHKFGDVFYAAILYSCSRSESLESRSLRSSRVNFHSKGLALLS